MSKISFNNRLIDCCLRNVSQDGRLLKTFRSRNYSNSPYTSLRIYSVGFVYTKNANCDGIVHISNGFTGN